MYDLKNPIRIHIDKLPTARFARPSETTQAYGEYWVVCGAYPPVPARVYRDARPARAYEDDIRNYVLLIDHDFSDDADRVRYVMWDEGDLREFYPDDAFEANVEAFIDHETRDPETGKPASGKRANELMYQDADDATGPVTTDNRIDFTHDEAIEYLNFEQNRWSFSQARLHRVDATIYEAIERAWNAANQFLSFSVASAR
jgi:hypothetical protein